VKHRDLLHINHLSQSCWRLLMWRHLVNEYETNTSVWLVGRLQVEGLQRFCHDHL